MDTKTCLGIVKCEESRLFYSADREVSVLAGVRSRGRPLNGTIAAFAPAHLGHIPALVNFPLRCIRPLCAGTQMMVLVKICIIVGKLSKENCESSCCLELGTFRQKLK